MKKKFLISAIAVIVIIAAYIFGTGFIKSQSAFIEDYSVSEDGTQMTIKVAVSSSAGHIRKVSTYQQQGGKLYLDFYSAFGGLNGRLCAKDEYTINIQDETEIIALFRNTDCYEEVLRKNADGQWERTQNFN